MILIPFRKNSYLGHMSYFGPNLGLKMMLPNASGSIIMNYIKFPSILLFSGKRKVWLSGYWIGVPLVFLAIVFLFLNFVGCNKNCDYYIRKWLCVYRFLFLCGSPLSWVEFYLAFFDYVFKMNRFFSVITLLSSPISEINEFFHIPCLIFTDKNEGFVVLVILNYITWFFKHQKKIWIEICWSKVNTSILEKYYVFSWDTHLYI